MSKYSYNSHKLVSLASESHVENDYKLHNCQDVFHVTCSISTLYSLGEQKDNELQSVPNDFGLNCWENKINDVASQNNEQCAIITSVSVDTGNKSLQLVYQHSAEASWCNISAWDTYISNVHI